MGKVEKEAKIRRTKRNIQNAVLATAGAAGIVAVAMLAPNIFQALPRIAGDKYKLPYRAKTAAGRLAQKGLVRFVERNGARYIEITDEGRRALLLEGERADLLKKRKRRWDKRYRLIMFDIPQKRKGVRERLRRYMQTYGFLRIQDSVWLYPYDCEELAALLKSELRIGKDVLYAVVESIENDGWIKKHFKLKS